ncbi:class I SAM-dependent methyltransferase [Mycolicibacterium sp. F2034L]|uniref:class I SAM-dependent methyltransferase n=1 Tax=Mycolicibacterium sp. F2034L TaxID=2926422 RepID=UPI001FF43E94|nr:class I SAM-dependent methyltransferase [Mycolicibacterium sp. F2034L]MCK0173992.1 class I SAM-dependent methyltransferase [Mycolicibacterium sp. F2034L]
MAAIDRQTVDHTDLHRLWKAIAIGIGLAVVVMAPALMAAVGILAVVLLCGRMLYRGGDRFIPNLYARDTRSYDKAYGAFIRQSLASLRTKKIAGHTLLWEASRLPAPPVDGAPELVLDLGVWIGWSTRLAAEASGRKVYGFDTFTGLVEDWQIDDQTLIKQGTFSISEPFARQFIRDTGVSLDGGVPTALGRDVEFIQGSTYDTLEPFLTERPGAAIRLFHMDLDTYESCLHALETCKDRFVEGSILVFDEYLVTNGEMRAFYEFQERYGLEWKYRAWGLEIMEMNVHMVASPVKRLWYAFDWISRYWLRGDGRYVWQVLDKRFWRFWLGAPIGDIIFMLGAAGQRKSVSIEITGLGGLQRSRSQPA